MNPLLLTPEHARYVHAAMRIMTPTTAYARALAHVLPRILERLQMRGAVTVTEAPRLTIRCLNPRNERTEPVSYAIHGNADRSEIRMNPDSFALLLRALRLAYQREQERNARPLSISPARAAGAMA